jgi:hypothetical protein
MLLSLGSYINTRVLTVHFVEATPRHRQWRDVAVWSGSENISEADEGSTGTRESLTSPHERNAGYGQPRDQGTGLHRELVAPVVMIRTSSKR